MYRKKFGRYDSSDDEAETDLIKSMMKSSVSQRTMQYE